MLWIDKKYADIAGISLSMFKWTKNNVANFRCPYCNDSQKKKTKARGYFYAKDNELYFRCHNCGVGRKMSTFLEDHFPALYDDYVLERFKGGGKAADLVEKKAKVPLFQKPVFKHRKEADPFDGCTSLAKLSTSHPVKRYAAKRRIPAPRWLDLYHCPDFSKLAIKIDPTIEEGRLRSEPRLVIPLRTKDGELFAVQGRCYGKNGLRYITIRNPNFEDHPKVYGLDRWNPEEHTYVFEGPIDSMFLPNSLAMAGASGFRSLNKENTTLVFDNEPRNKEICNAMWKAIKDGWSVCIWQCNNSMGKDVNELIMNGISANDVKWLIDDSTRNGLEAELAYADWHKIE